MKGINCKLKRKIYESFKRKLKESFRNDFFDWYDMLSPEKQAEVDAFAEDEGYPEFLSDCSDSDLELIMDHFNPEFFDDYYESKKSTKSKMRESIKKSLNEEYIDGSYEQILSSENLVVNECRYDDYDILILYFTFDDKYKAYVVSTYEGPALIASKEGFDNFQSAVDWAEIVMDNDSRNFEESVSKSNSGNVKESIKKNLEEGKLHPFTKEDWYGYAGAEKFPDGSEPMIYEDPDTGNAVIVSYDSTSEDISVEVDIWTEDDSQVDGFIKEYQGDREQAIADAEEIINKGILQTGDTSSFGPDWTKAG